MKCPNLPCLLALAMVCLTWRPAFALPASPDLHVLRQGDGARFTARQWGDEYLSGWETDDGYTIVFDSGLGCWTYAGHGQAGGLVSSHLRPDRGAPPAGVQKHIRPKRPPVSDRLSAATLQLPSLLREPPPLTSARSQTSPEPPTTRNLPVILVNFSDTATTFSTADFTSLLFGTGVWSFREYYEEVSGGLFSVSQGSSGVAGWVTASNTHDYYGSRSVIGHIDAWPGDLVYEAVQQADAALDFSAYDNDGDCSVDTVAIVHQGTAQEGSGIAADIWSHSMSLSVTYQYGLSHYGPYIANDRCRSDPARFVVVDRYIIMPERYGSNIAGIGVFAHEYGHTLGLVDLYDSDNSSEGVGDWSLMASGSWGGVDRLGDRPSHPDPWSKSVMGWVTPFRIMGGMSGRVMGAVETGGEVGQFLGRLSEGGAGEYFLLENRQQTGFDAALPGSGLLLWHIDETRTGNSYEWYPGCTSCTSHYKVALVQADNLFQLEKKLNRGDAGDPFPGSADNRAITPSTLPPATLYSGVPAGFGISAISDSAAVMTADFSLYDLTPPVTSLLSFPTDVSSSRSGRFTFSASEPAGFDCKLDDDPFLPCGSPFIFSDLADGGHTFTVRATDSAGNVETAPPTYAWTIDTVTPLCNAMLDGSCYQGIAAAYAAIPPGSSRTIRLRRGDHAEDVDLGRGVGVRLEGGYDGDFEGRAGTSTVAGRVKVSGGSLVADRVVVRYDPPQL